MVADLSPITAIGVVADKKRCPENFKPIICAHDDASVQADVWKDGFFSFTSVYRYIVYSKHIDTNITPISVVADLSIINEHDLIPPGFTAVEKTFDTREKALRKKQICVRMMPLETAVDAVCDVVILAKTKHAPAGYMIAGDVDGLMICFKYSTIPANLLELAKGQPSTSSTLQQHPNHAAMQYPSLPYPGHPNAVETSMNGGTPTPGAYTMMRQNTVAATGVDGVPFQLNPVLKVVYDRQINQRSDSSSDLSNLRLKEYTNDQLDNEFAYDFVTEQRCLESMLLSAEG